MLKKLTVMAMAVGVVAALALPASASAAWKHHNTPLASDAQVGFTGNTRFQGGLGGVECQVTSRVQFLAGQTTANAETFVPHPTDATTNCKGLGGLAFCQIHNVTPIGMPWGVHTGPGNDVTITAGEITSTTSGGFCPVQHILLTGASLTGEPNQPNTVSSLTLSGSMQVHMKTNSGASDTETVQVSGTLNIESPDANTYSI